MQEKIIIITEGAFDDLSCAQNTNKLLSIIREFFDEIYLITYCNKDLISLDNINIFSLDPKNNFFICFLSKQIQSTLLLLKIYRKYKVRSVMFAFGNDLLILPLLFAKILRLKVILRSDGKPSITTKYNLRFYVFFKYLIKIIEFFNYNFCDILLTESKYMIDKYGFGKYNAAVGSLFIDSKFNKLKVLNDRKYDLGFIGKFNEEKQPLKFLSAVNNVDNNCNVLIIGYGPDENKVITEIKKINNRKSKNVEHIRWVNHDNLYLYLNEVKLFVLPSLREGLPNVLMEAMSCGCIVLATDVGGIKGLINDNFNGYLLKDSNIDTLSKSIQNISQHKDLEKMSNNASKSIRIEYSYSAILKQWETVLIGIYG